MSQYNLLIIPDPGLRTETTFEHFEVADACMSFLFAILTVLSMVGEKEVEPYQSDEMALTLGNHARLGLLLLETAHSHVEAMREIERTKVYGKKEGAGNETGNQDEQQHQP